MRTQDVLNKIEGTKYKATLEYKRHERKRFEDNGFVGSAEGVKKSIAGYVQALRDCDIITERERQVLFIYYGTV